MTSTPAQPPCPSWRAARSSPTAGWRPTSSTTTASSCPTSRRSRSSTTSGAGSCCWRYYGDYVDIAERAGAALQLETPTWRASSDWGDRLGYSAAELRRVNRDAVALLAQAARRGRPRLVPDQRLPRPPRRRLRRRRGDRSGRRRRPTTPRRSRRSPRPAPIWSPCSPSPAPARRSASSAPPAPPGCPVAVSFTVEQDGRLPDGTPLATADRRGRRRGRPRLLHGQLRPPHATSPRRWPTPAPGAHASSGSGPTRRRSATRSSTPPPSWTRATRRARPRPGRAAAAPAEPRPGRRLLRHRRPPRRRHVGCRLSRDDRAADEPNRFRRG